MGDEAMTLEEMFLCLDGLRFRKQNSFDMKKARWVFNSALSRFPADVRDKVRGFCVKEKLLLPAMGCDEALQSIESDEVDPDTQTPEPEVVSEVVKPRENPAVTVICIDHSPDEALGNIRADEVDPDTQIPEPDQSTPLSEDEAGGGAVNRPWNRIPPGVEASILRDFEAGENKSALAIHYGVTRRTVQRLIARCHRAEVTKQHHSQ